MEQNEISSRISCRLPAIVVIIAVPLLISGCEPAHELDDRVRLLECRQLNSDLRNVFGETGTSDVAVNAAIAHDDRTIEHDERTVEHDERVIEHDERPIEHDERTIDHDETFVNLASCRKDTLNLQKKYLSCAKKRVECPKAPGKSFPMCNEELRQCAMEVRNPGE